MRELAQRFSAQESTSDIVLLGDRLVEGTRNTAESTAEEAKKVFESGVHTAGVVSADLKRRMDSGRVVAADKAVHLREATQHRLEDAREATNPGRQWIGEKTRVLSKRLKTKIDNWLPSEQEQNPELQEMARPTSVAGDAASPPAGEEETRTNGFAVEGTTPHPPRA